LWPRYAARHLLRAGNGSVIAIASMYGLVGQYERVAYCAAKHGAIGMVRAMALDFADKGVRVNAIAPGFIETELSRQIAGQEPDPEAAMRPRRAMHAIPRAGQPEEIGEAATYVASDAASFTTGRCLTLDGGMRRGEADLLATRRAWSTATCATSSTMRHLIHAFWLAARAWIPLAPKCSLWYASSPC
jgi:NAD(P)-dependent dehydrogenase (short-subunit alcohol dehydrogenase family)